ncbi:MAG: LytR/AlgR family response regulator transcription factor, partial [Saprospiraceae bacterium]
MNQLNCIIIEDQIPAQQTLQEYIRQVPYLHLLATYISPIEAMQQLEDGSVDLVFLDIHLPKINGIDFLAALRQPPHIILTTAFSEYAVQGFELDVVDYLLKPYSFQRFLKAILKIQRIENSSEPTTTSAHLFIKTKQQQIEKIFLPNIQYIEAKGDFVMIHTAERTVIATIALQQ